MAEAMMEHDLLAYQAYLLAGLAFLLGIACLIAYWRKSVNPAAFGFLAVLLVVFVWPPTFLAMTSYNLDRSKSVQFCAGCHQMDQHVANVTDPESKSLAAKHFKRYWVNKNTCYTCHTDYSLFGPVKAKMNGLVHMYYAYFTGIKEDEIEIYKPYPDHNCLQCHETRRFDKVEEHGERGPDERCVDCHDDVHENES